MSKTSNSKPAHQWLPSVCSEQRRLAVAQSGWNLAGSRKVTTGTRRKKPPPLDVALTNETDELSAMTAPSASSSPKESKKPPHCRVILDVEPMRSMLETHLAPCPQCGARLALSFPTSCLATGCHLSCPNFGPKKDDCKFMAKESAESANLPLPEDSTEHARNTDHAVNILFVVSFIASGDGGTEAARLLGLLGLPNSTTMQSRSFGNIEATISPVLLRLADRIIYDNLCEEVRLTYEDRVDENNNLLYDRWLKEEDLPEALWPRVKAGTDMGWQQKGSGRRYNSKSGHCFFCGALTRLAIAKKLCSKLCAVCKSFYTTHVADGKAEPPDHDCTINFEGSSGSMEPEAVLQCFRWLYDNRVIVDVIISDDDSSISQVEIEMVQQGPHGE